VEESAIHQFTNIIMTRIIFVMTTGALACPFFGEKMKRTVSLLFICVCIFKCYAINFEIVNKNFPYWAFQQNYCSEEETDPENHNNIVLSTHLVQAFPFPFTHRVFDFLVDKNITWNKMTIYSFSYQSEDGEVTIIKNKKINNERMFNIIKDYHWIKEMEYFENVMGKIVYSFDDGEIITEYTELRVW
jgi:hypothetical protein